MRLSLLHILQYLLTGSEQELSEHLFFLMNNKTNILEVSEHITGLKPHMPIGQTF
jgi:hypothetical protein